MHEQFIGAEKRAALEIGVVRDSLDSLGGKARWVTHNRNPSDCLSKIRGDVDCLLRLIRSGIHQPVDEQSEMDNRKEYRERTGKSNPRPKQAIG